MADRYFVAAPVEGDRAQLAGPEAHHLAHVMRAKPGDEVVLFDGSGCEFRATVERVGRSEIELSILSRAAIDREAALEVTLGVALPKGDRQRWLIEKTVELGVARLVPLVTERGNPPPAASALDRLRRTMIEASKQSGRNRLMEIAEPRRLVDFAAAVDPALACRWLAHPGGEELFHALARVRRDDAPPAAAAAAVGPEGGFTDAEVQQALAAGWRTVNLGPRILRIETAALVLATALAL